MHSKLLVAGKICQEFISGKVCLLWTQKYLNCHWLLRYLLMYSHYSFYSTRPLIGYLVKLQEGTFLYHSLTTENMPVFGET